MADSVDRWIFVESTGRRYHYESISGDSMAIDESSRREPRQEGDEVVADMTALDVILAELGLVDLHLGRQLVNRFWRLLRFDKTELGGQPTKQRLYRLGDPRRDY